MSDIAQIAAFWGDVEGEPKLAAARENRVYDTTIGGERLALRVHRAGYQPCLLYTSDAADD